jgi:hypothetical protein
MRGGKGFFKTLHRHMPIHRGGARCCDIAWAETCCFPLIKARA